jgi:hypothetical protein
MIQVSVVGRDLTLVFSWAWISRFIEPPTVQVRRVLSPPITIDDYGARLLFWSDAEDALKTVAMVPWGRTSPPFSSARQIAARCRPKDYQIARKGL